MAYKVHRVEIQEVIRRWQAGNSQRSIATGTGLSRETVWSCGRTRNVTVRTRRNGKKR